ncbi:MAG: hypothetical protein HYS12_01790 [Planctomycetes bacterium]|nr:hypothetical protein [Planctomycetota bacterium]
MHNGCTGSSFHASSRATQREQRLKQEVARLQAERRDLQHRLFGRKSEAHHTPDQLVPDDAHTRCPATSPDGATTPESGRPRPTRFLPPAHHRSTVLEIEVKAHRRLVPRKR